MAISGGENSIHCFLWSDGPSKHVAVGMRRIDHVAFYFTGPMKSPLVAEWRVDVKDSSDIIFQALGSSFYLYAHDLSFPAFWRTPLPASQILGFHNILSSVF